jgi:hypothetical protein
LSNSLAKCRDMSYPGTSTIIISAATLVTAYSMCMNAPAT